MATTAEALLHGIAVLFAGSLPWIAFLAVNLRVGKIAPWSILPMAVYLWCYWKYIGGSWGALETAGVRRTNLRANALSAEMWAAAIFAGLSGFAALVALIVPMGRIISLPQAAPLTAPAGMPAITAFLLLVTSSIVAGITEEAAFRGYMQGPIEKQYGLALAILVNGMAFGLLHFPNHPADVWKMLPYYIAVSAVYGGLTWAANSILPAVVLHAGGDVWSLGRLWLTGRPEWQMSVGSPALVWETGVDTSFLILIGVFAVLAGLTAWAYIQVYELRRKV